MATIKDIIDEARENLGRDQNKLVEDSAYYEAEVMLDRKGHTIPTEFRDIKAAVGWSRLYLDALVARIEILGFRSTNDVDIMDSTIEHWWRANELAQESQISFLETFIHGRSFISISAPSDEDVLAGHPADAPIIRIESPQHMWVDIDKRTKRVNWAVRFYMDPNTIQGQDANQQYTVYLPDRTVYVEDARNGRYRVTDEDVHDLGIVPIVPSLNRERVSDRFGRSEIIPELRSAQDIATRVILNMRVASDLMATPQRLLFGVEKDAIIQNQEPAAQYKAYMAGILAFGDENAKASQFSAAELSNYTNVLQELAKFVAAYTGLPPQYLSFSGQQPASAEAIRSAEERLVKSCEMKGSMLGAVWVRVMKLGALVMGQAIPEEWNRLDAILADPSTPTYAAKADAAMKLTGGKAIIPVKQARIDMEYTPAARAQMELWDAEERIEYLGALTGSAPTPLFPMQTTSATKAVDPSAQTVVSSGGNDNTGGATQNDSTA